MSTNKDFETNIPGTTPKVGEAAARVRQDVNDLGAALAQRKQELTGTLGSFVQERPMAAVGAAFGIGYVLGGGLFSRFTGRVVGVGLRLGAMAFLRQMVQGMGADFGGAGFSAGTTGGGIGQTGYGAGPIGERY